MTDFHHNVFYYYRGARQVREHLYDQQLEDNTTKALANTLTHTSPEVANKFLHWLGIPGSGRPRVELQRKSIGKHRISRTTHRLLLELVARAAQQEDSVDTTLALPGEGDTRPDAWLYGDDYVVLIESKVGDAQLQLAQRERHFQKLCGEPPRQPRREQRTWAQVHGCFLAIASELENGTTDKWLVKQFTQYLEWQGMSDFAGFEEAAFDFFLRDEEEREPDTKRWVRGRMRALAEKVLENGLRSLAPSFYQVFHVGNIGARADHCWVAFGPDDPGFKAVAHQTVSIYEYGLDVFANVELRPAVNKLRSKMRTEKEEFRQVISALPEPFTIQIQERKKRQYQQYDYFPIAKLEGRADARYGPFGLKDPQSCSFDYLERLIEEEEIEYPYLSVRRTIPRERVLKLSERNAGRLVDDVIGMLREFHKFVDFVNR